MGGEKDTFLSIHSFGEHFFILKEKKFVYLIPPSTGSETNQIDLRDGESQVAEAPGSVSIEMRPEEGVVGS